MTLSSLQNSDLAEANWSKSSRTRNILWRYQSKDWKWPWLVGFERFERCWPLWPLWGICYTSCLLKFGHQTLNWPSIRYTVSDKIFLALPLCQKNWFCGKVRLDDIYRLLRSKSSSWIHIVVKRISQACCLHHLKNIEKNCKTQLWDEKQNRALFWATLWIKTIYKLLLNYYLFKVKGTVK